MDSWRCAKCGCRSYARIDQPTANGTFKPGDNVRCLSCKDVSYLPISAEESDIKTLEKALREAKAKRDKEIQESLDNIPLVFEYHIEWKSEHVFYCYKIGSKETINLYNKWCKKHSTSAGKFHDINEQKGMEYLLIGNFLAKASGGTLILKSTLDGNDPFDAEPRLITNEERDLLLAGIVPDSLKAF